MTATHIPFVPTNEWQECLPTHIFPPGCVFELNMETGKQYATWDRGAATPPFIPSAPGQTRESAAAVRPVFATMSPLEVATYMRDVQKQRPVPNCDPGHLYVSARHRDGYIDKQGRKRPGCRSPGKAPLVLQWQRFSHQAPTDDELTAMFATHKGNIGNAVLDGRVMVDVDVRTGGLETLKLLEDVYDPLPDTPTQRTGGGGYHYHFLWPEDVPLPAAGGSLASLGYPGIEWKGPTQQVIVAPSTYAGTGAAYAWVEGKALEDIEVAPIPAWLLALVLKVNTVRSPRPATELNPAPRGNQPGAGRPKLTHTEIVMAFRQMYPEGGRRAGTGVPRLVGILMGHGVEEDMAVNWFHWWQPIHLLPPLSDAEMEALVRDMYRRYGNNEQGTTKTGGHGAGSGEEDNHHHAAAHIIDKGRDVTDIHGKAIPQPKANRADRRSAHSAHDTRGHTFLNRLFKEVAGQTGPRTDRPTISPTGDPITRDEAADLTRRAIAEMRNDALFSQRRQAQNRLPDSTPNSDMRKAILIADRRFILSKDELYDKLAFAEGPDAKVLERLEHCLWDGAMTCWEHGDQFETKCMCRLFVHYDCIHQSTLKVRQLELSDIPKDKGCYISLRIRWGMPVYTDIDSEHRKQITSAFFGMERTAFQHEVRKLGQRKRKRIGGTMLAHSMGFLLARPDSIVEGRLLFRLDGTDRSRFDAVVAGICERLGAHVTGERIYQEGESVVVQLMEDSMSGFLGMKDKTDDDLFAAFYWDLKGKILFQGMDELYQMLRAIKKEEPALCPICQRVLRLRPIPPGTEDKKRFTSKEGVVLGSSPSPPVPKQSRLAV